MAYRPSTLERAFALARSGAVPNIASLRRALSAEGYSDVRAQTDGRQIMKQLQGLIEGARDGVKDGQASDGAGNPAP